MRQVQTNLGAVDVSLQTIRTYLDHAFDGMAKVLDRHDDLSVNECPQGWGTNSVAGFVVHCCELAPWWFALGGLGREIGRDRDSEFTTTATVAELRTRIAETATELDTLIQEFETGPTTTEHEIRTLLPKGDQTDGGLLLHVFEEFFQHLGHMEVITDALGR